MIGLGSLYLKVNDETWYIKITGFRYPNKKSILKFDDCLDS